ncbi:MAG: nickel insertion protein [Pseudanabaenaceae cyanobacterium bins.68]|nr:nickel insertion protein [Pseudanabaenaceae cyanobacterium bins.68]
MLETQVDDMTAQAIAYVSNQLLKHGALDVFSQGITMKKSRLGTLITVICSPDQITTCEQILWQETTTLGIRKRWQERIVIDRELIWLDTKYGKARIKLAHRPDRLTYQPEYEDCVLLAQKHQVPLAEVYQAIQTAAELVLNLVP